MRVRSLCRMPPANGVGTYLHHRTTGPGLHHTFARSGRPVAVGGRESRFHGVRFDRSPGGRRDHPGSRSTPLTMMSPSDSEAFATALIRAKAEFLEMPGLSLTLAQAARLWALDTALCSAVISALVDSRFLIQRRDARFSRA